MAWPNSRLTTYTAATPVKSADLNAIQDAIISPVHGDRILMIPGASGRANSGTTLNASGYAGSISSTASTTIVWTPQLHQGDRIKSLLLRYLGNGAADIGIVDVMRRNGSTGTNIAGAGTTPPANTPASPDSTFLVTLTPYTLLAGDIIMIGVVPNATGLEFFSWALTYDHP
jgi:hypothetical protein